MGRFLTNLTSGLIVASIAGSLVRPAGAEVRAANESLCESLATTPKPRTASDFETMTGACGVAAHWHETRALNARGAAAQQQAILQATYLYFAAEGDAGSHRNAAAVTALRRSRALYRGVFANAANAALRKKARRGLEVVGEALAPTLIQPRPFRAP